MDDFYPLGRWLSRAGLGALVVLTAVACATGRQAVAPSPPTAPAVTPGATAGTGSPAACRGPNLPDASVSPLPPGAVTGTATLGSRTVTVTGKPARTFSVVGLTSAGISIADHGSVLLSGRLDPPTDTVVAGVFALGNLGVTPSATAPTSTATGGSVCLARFGGEVTPTALVAFYSGGAHCCTFVRAYPPAASGLGPPVDINLGDPGGDLAFVGDHAILLTGDDAFAYTFDSFAGSGLPIKVLDLRDGAFADVTREHLDLVRTDLALWTGLMAGDASTPPDEPGIVAAWAADECLLGQGTQAFATLDSLNAEGKLHGSPNGGPDTSGKAFETALRDFLRQHGYCA